MSKYRQRMYQVESYVCNSNGRYSIMILVNNILVPLLLLLSKFIYILINMSSGDGAAGEGKVRYTA